MYRTDPIDPCGLWLLPGGLGPDGATRSGLLLEGGLGVDDGLRLNAGRAERECSAASG